METQQTLVTEICPTTTQKWIAKGAMLVDVREKEEVEQLSYAIPNLVNIPLSEFETRYIELPLDKMLVTVCHSGTRSLRAAGFLLNHGYDPGKVVNMKHGMVRWAQKGFPTKGDTSTVLDNLSSSDCCGTTHSSSAKHSCCGSTNSESSGCC